MRKILDRIFILFIVLNFRLISVIVRTLYRRRSILIESECKQNSVRTAFSAVIISIVESFIRGNF